MLSDKLLSKTDYSCDREIRTLELLKLRFGDANLHNCEVGILAMPHPTVVVQTDIFTILLTGCTSTDTSLLCHTGCKPKQSW